MAAGPQEERPLGFMAQLKKTVWDRIKDWGYEFETKNVRKALGIGSDQRQYSAFIHTALNALVKDQKLRASQGRLPVKYKVLR